MLHDRADLTSPIHRVSNHPHEMREARRPSISPLSFPPSGPAGSRFCDSAFREAITYARLSLLRILYHSRHVPQTLFQGLRELHRAGPAVAVEGRDREDKAVLLHIVGAPVAVRHHRPVSGDHVVLRGHLWDKACLHFKRHAVSHENVSLSFLRMRRLRLDRRHY